MAQVKTKYTGNLSTSTHYPLSDNPILTKADPFGPTDLLSVSLSSCIATYISFMARKNNFETPGLDVEIKKTMNEKGTKVIEFDVIVNLGKQYSATQKVIIEHASKTCPVGNSLSNDIIRSYVFNY